MSTRLPSLRTSYLFLIAALFGLVTVAVVISCAAVHTADLACQEQPAKYILVFGDDPPNPDHRVMVNMTAFENALKMHPPNWKCGLKKKLTPQGQEEDVPMPTPQSAAPGTVTIHRWTFKSQAAPDKSAGTMHVTQKVGLNSLDQAEALRKAVLK